MLPVGISQNMRLFRPSAVPVFTGCLGGLAAALNSSPVLTGCLQNSLRGSARFSQSSLVSSGSSVSSSVAVTWVLMLGHSRSILRVMVILCGFWYLNRLGSLVIEKYVVG